MATPQVWAHINAAAERVEQNLLADSKFKTLAQLLRTTPNQPSLSGLEDIDYPNMLNLSRKIPLTSNVSSVPLPTQVIEQFNKMQQNCTLGVFPEISRAWLSVDSNIYFWAYDNGSDIAYYDGLKETILAVHLLKPRPNVFKPHVKYLLCLVTALEITLLGISIPDESPNSLPAGQITTDIVFKLSTDNVTLQALAGTDDGRIFMGGNDGSLYEIVYQAEDGWFSRKCRKINHSYSYLTYVTPSFLNREQEPIVQIEIDNTRQLLYARTEKGSIQMYDLGTDGSSMTMITSKTLPAIVNQASCVARTVDIGIFKPFIGIKALTRGESDSIHLMAVTQAGVRLYFSACGGERPTSLELVHVRLPPGHTPPSGMQKPNSVSNIYYQDNTFIMTSSQTENKDFLWIFSNDFYVYENQMMEAFNINSLGGRVWCIAEEKRSNTPKASFEHHNPPLVVKQHFEERRKFILLTSEGVHIFYKQRPIDQLNLLLVESQGAESPLVRSFFDSTNLAEACLTSIILASSSNLPQEKQLVEWATLALFRYGGEPKLIRPNNQTNTFMPSMSTPIGSPAMHSTGINVSPISGHYNNNAALASEQIEVQFSARHDAVYLYLARILRPIWSSKVATIETFEGTHKILKNTSSIEEIILYIKRLMELKRFLDTNFPVSIDQNKPTKMGIRGQQTSDPSMIERESINSLIRLLVRSVEVLNLYKLLYEHQFSIVCANLPADPQMKLSVMTFRDLIVLGSDMTTSIAGALVRRYLDDNITTDAISRRLYELCPSIFRQENALQAKAHEMILQSRALADKIDKERMMNEAVSLLKQIGARLELSAVCDLLHSVRAYKYIVDICLFIAEKRDPLNLAGFQQNRVLNNILDDGEERTRATAFTYRMDCYTKIIDTLNRLINNENFDEVFDFCIKSTDELFHTKLYEWLCEKNLSSKLLDVKSPYVESFLKKKADTDSYSTSHLDLMWRFYERRGNFFRAAQILDKLASKPCMDYGLDERLEYLCRAKGCIEALATPGEYLHELEEKMDVLRIQIQVYKKLRELPESPLVLDAISQLNYSLSDLTQLYSNYAQKFNLYDCQLSILKCGNHHDPTLIERLWKNIIDEILATNQNESPDTQLHILSNHIESVGKTLMPSERFFPINFIISYLEYRTHTFGNLRWVPHCLIKIGFKPINLLDPYHKFYKSREHSLYWPDKTIHSLQVIAQMIEDALRSNPDRSFATACLDVICDYLIDLQTMVTSDSSVKKLQQDFSILQSRINQLIS